MITRLCQCAGHLRQYSSTTGALALQTYLAACIGGGSVMTKQVVSTGSHAGDAQQGSGHIADLIEWLKHNGAQPLRS